MLPHCLIILCLGAYINCKPAPNPTTRKEFIQGLIETQDRLAGLRQRTKAIPKDPAMTSLLVPENFKEFCAKDHLDVFINSLELVRAETDDNFCIDNLRSNLKHLKEYLPKNYEKNEDCTAPRKSVDKLLEYLTNFLKTLHSQPKKQRCELGPCK